MSSSQVGNTRQPGSKQKLQISPAKHWCFTYNNYTKENLVAVRELCSNSSIVLEYVFQEETGEEGTPHLQGYIAFQKKCRPKKLLPDQVHWEKCRNVKAAKEYCHKSETRTGEVFTNIKFPRELVKMTYEKLRPWQREIADQFKEPEDPLFGRTIYWYWEPTGNVGKTVLSMYFTDVCGAIILGGKGSDIKCGLAKYIDANGAGPDMVVIDIPRCVEHISWDGIECAKNGIFFSGKYESGMVRYNRPHVVCFANRPPPLEKLSEDRWKVYEIDEYSQTLRG
jgi:hypothetical protein